MDIEKIKTKVYEERRIEYLYSHKGKYLLVPNTPVEVCGNCGMVYYDAAVLKKIEQPFFSICHFSRNVWPGGFLRRNHTATSEKAQVRWALPVFVPELPERVAAE